jgi:hypothetical protein
VIFFSRPGLYHEETTTFEAVLSPLFLINEKKSESQYTLFEAFALKRMCSCSLSEKGAEEVCARRERQDKDCFLLKGSTMPVGSGWW